MWQSITKIQKPNSFQNAMDLVDNNAVFLSGGSYLNLEMNPKISTLIDINSMLSSEITQDGDDIKVGAKTSLQKLVDNFSGVFSDCAHWSCTSKNIRNQRTIGGEIATMRLDSELYILLRTMDVQLNIYNGEEITISLSQWDGKGIITQIHLNKMDIENSLVKRFALIPSAPAFLIAAATISSSSVSFGIGGKVGQISNYSTSIPPSEKDIEQIIKSSSVNFFDDYFGSISYKKVLLKTALKRLGGDRW